MKPWVQSLALHKPSVEAHACNPNIQEVNLGKLGVQGHLQGLDTDCQVWWQSPLLKSSILFSFMHMDIDFYQYPFLGGGFSYFSKGSQSSRWSRLLLCLIMIWDGWLPGGTKLRSLHEPVPFSVTSGEWHHPPSLVPTSVPEECGVGCQSGLPRICAVLRSRASIPMHLHKIPSQTFASCTHAKETFLFCAP